MEHQKNKNKTVYKIGKEVVESGPRYLVIYRTEEGRKFTAVSPFVIQKGLDAIAGPVKSCIRSRNGTLLVEAHSATQAAKLLKAERLSSYPIRVELHKTLNSSRGVVNTRALDGLTDEEIVENLKDQGVVSVYRVQRKDRGELVPTRTLFLTFDRVDLPQKIRAGYEIIEVRPYIPNPLRCYKCQRYGHTRDSCNGDNVCVNCAQALHEGECTSAPNCVNCGGEHPSSSRECPRYTVEKAIQEIRVREKVSFSEARKLFGSREAPVPKSGTYSAVLAKQVQVREIATQTTDLNAPTISERTIVPRTSKPQLPKPVTTSAKSTASTASTSPSRPSTSRSPKTIEYNASPKKFRTNYDRSDFLKVTRIPAPTTNKKKGPKTSQRSSSEESTGGSPDRRNPSAPIPTSNRFECLEPKFTIGKGPSPVEEMEQDNTARVAVNKRQDEPAIKAVSPTPKKKKKILIRPPPD